MNLTIQAISENETILVIGIVSAHEHFKQRELARSTWMKELLSYEGTVKAFFILGSQTCLIPKSQKVDPYACEWNSFHGFQKKNMYDFIHTSEEISDLADSHDFIPEEIFHIGFSFKVNQPLIVTKLGVLHHLLIPGVTIMVSLMNVQYREVVMQANMSSGEYEIVRGFAYTNVEKISLPKNYEGLVLVEGISTGRAKAKVIWNNAGGIINFQRIYTTPEHLDSVKFSSSNFSAASIGVQVPETSQQQVHRMQEELLPRQNQLKELSELVKKEVEEKKDIVLVDVVDTYRSLPEKLLKFYAWLHCHHSFKYVMKMDDDTMVNIPLLLRKLQSAAVFDPGKPWLWGSFRKNWPVNYVGKWIDYDYRGSYYPMFPCGAAYVMSHTTSKWLVSNAEYLHHYQGEDISMGIWLSAILPAFIEDEYFSCDEECRPESYNRAQLTVEEMPQAWSNFKQCQNFCDNKCIHSS